MIHAMTPHQVLINEFMRLAGQEVPDSPVIPDLETRKLRARLILEEAFETVHGLGLAIKLVPGSQQLKSLQYEGKTFFNYTHLELCPNERGPVMIEIADGCADLSVVTIGTLSACGIVDTSLLLEVDDANLRKFGPGSSRRDDGKWIKPPDFRPPDIARVLREQGWEPYRKNS